MKLLIDMNLSPEWVTLLEHLGWPALHWSTIGDPCATDRAIMDWALANGYIVLTHDLDFSALLASTRLKGPSVIQIRTQDVTPMHLKTIVIEILQEFQTFLEQGALVTIDENKSRVRILPLIS